MEELFKTVLSMSIGAGVLAAMVLIVRAVIGRRQTMVLTILFAMLIAKLIVPLSIESDASVFNLLPSSISQSIAAEQPIDADTTSVTTNNYVAFSDSEPTLEYEKEMVQETVALNEAVADQPVNISVNNTVDTVAPDKPAKPISPWQIAAIVWLCGMAAFTAVITVSNVAFVRKVNRNRAYTSPGFNELIRNCADELGVKQKIRAVQMSDINTVAVCGIFRPKLLVSPETFDSLTIHEKRNVLMHELSHIRRKDTLTCLIITVVNILHWFNPIVWAAFAVFRKDIEVMCDAKVLRKMDNAGRRSYAHTLFTLAKNSSKTNTRFAMALFMSKATIKRRIAMIAKYKKNSPLIIALALILAVGIAVTGCTTPKTDTADVKEQDKITVDDTQKTPVKDEFKNEGATNVPLGFQIASGDFGNGEGIFEEPSVHNVYKAIDMLNGLVFKPDTETVLFDKNTINAESGWLKEPNDNGSFTLSSGDKLFEFPTGGREMVLGLVLDLASSIGLYVGEFDKDGYFIHEKEAIKNVYDSDVVLRVWFDEKDYKVYAEFYSEDSDVKDKILASEVAPTLMTSYSLDYKSHMRENSQYNIEKALSMLNNSVIGPGEQLSLNAILGARTNENGWKETPEFSAGRYVSQIGGGVSAVATTLYNAALRSELEIVESSPHASVTDYVDGGLDATISTVAPDLIIANPYQIDVFIKCRLDGNNIVVDIYGSPMEYTVDFLSIRVATMHAPEAVYHYNSETTPDGSPIAEGVSVLYTQSRPGHTCEVYKIKYDLQGNEIERKLFDTVVYRPFSEQIYINESVPE